MTTLIDGDIIAYRCAYSCEDTPDDLHDMIDDMIDHIKSRTTNLINLGETKVFLTGKTNFRNDIATIAPYKGHRSKEKPTYLGDARRYLLNDYNAALSDNQEADDDISIMAASLDYLCTVASIDKDFLQLPCTHYNWNHDTLVEQSEEAATKFFYTQLLTGDTADNIKGAKGIGIKKAEKLLDGVTDERELYELCLGEGGYKGDVDCLIENARLLWLRRYDDQMWEPPKENEDA